MKFIIKAVASQRGEKSLLIDVALPRRCHIRRETSEGKVVSQLFQTFL